MVTKLTLAGGQAFLTKSHGEPFAKQRKQRLATLEEAERMLSRFQPGTSAEKKFCNGVTEYLGEEQPPASRLVSCLPPLRLSILILRFLHLPTHRLILVGKIWHLQMA
jgi:hypothetical protein